MQRREDWPERLEFFVENYRHSFIWGTLDCAHFATRAIRWMTDRDLMQELYEKRPMGRRLYQKRPRYESKIGATRIMKRDFAGGVHELCEVVAEIFNLQEVPSTYARRGDLVIIDSAEGDVLGICLGSKFVSIGYEGLVYFDLGKVLRAWRI